MRKEYFPLRYKSILSLVLVIFLINIHFFSLAQTPEQPKNYICHKTNLHPIIDGDINDSVWNLAEKTDYFVDIQGSIMPKPRFQTYVKLLWSDSFLYVAAFMEEPHLWANLTKDESIIFYDNDFEIFIDPDGDRQNYYEFEFNQLNKKWDLFLPLSYMDFGKPIYEFNPRAMKYKTKLYGSINDASGKNDSAWTMEIAIPLYCLSETSLDRKFPSSGDCWRINFSRVEWQTKVEDDQYIKLEKPEDNWVWSPQHLINMHRPEQWGYLIFADDKKSDPTNFSDKYWLEKMELMKVYYAELDYYKKFGKYVSIKDLNLKEDSKVQLFFSEYQYIASIKTLDKTTYFIDNTGKLWQR